jgi:hypothetical protein
LNGKALNTIKCTLFGRYTSEVFKTSDV